MGFEDSPSAAALLGMDGFVLVAAGVIDGELHQVVETTASVVGCPACGTRAMSKGRREVKVRDMASAERPVVVVWRKRLWRCEDPDCDNKSWSEQAGAIAPRASLTRRARANICVRVGRDGHSVAAVAAHYGVGWATAMGAVLEHGAPLVDDAGRIGEVDHLGLDETAFQAANAKRHTSYVTGIVDTKGARLLDIIEGRNAVDLRNWLAERPREWLDAVKVVSVDPHEGYRNGILPDLAHVQLVADPFHIVALANRALDKARRRVQNETLGHRGHSRDPLYRIRRVLLTGAERLSERGWERFWAGLREGDPFDVVGAVWLAKEHLRDVYLSEDPAEAERLLGAVIAECDAEDIPELVTLATTLRRWRSEILAHHVTGASNGPTEGLNLLVKKIKRVGHGFRSFRNYRLRLLLHCGVAWETSPTARMRGRSPRLVA